MTLFCYPLPVRPVDRLMTLLIVLLLPGLVACYPSLHYCHRLDPLPHRRYATKTSYDDVRSRDVDEYLAATSKSDDGEDAMKGTARECALQPHSQAFPNGYNNTLEAICHRTSATTSTTPDTARCSAMSIYVLARHGTRYNKVRNMDRMAARLLDLRQRILQHAASGTMCTQDLEWLRSWIPRHTLENESTLSESGWEEMTAIARRYRQLYPALFGTQYVRSRYEFRYTNYTDRGQRTRDSARAFALGLWGRYDNVEMIENSRPDWLLQFYEYCLKYVRLVGSQPVAEYESFKRGKEMVQVLSSVNRRLGLPEGTLGIGDMYLIFENCRLEHGLYRDAAWCSILTPWMLEVIEYHQDVKYYYEDSYPNSISYTPACTIVRDVATHLLDDVTLGRFRFTHSGTLDGLYSRLGLYRDAEPLRADNMQRQRGRKWRTSLSTPMAANIAFIKYRCEEQPVHRVMIVINEHTRTPVVLPGCQTALCPIDTLLALWQPIIDDCDIDRMCEQNGAEHTT